MSVVPLLQRFVDDEFVLAPTWIAPVRPTAVQQPQALGVAAPDLPSHPGTAPALPTRVGRSGEQHHDALRDLMRNDMQSLERPTTVVSGVASERLALLDGAPGESDIKIARAGVQIAGAVESKQRRLQALTSALRGAVRST